MCTALVMGNMIGSGIFLLPASLGPFGGISIIGWVVSAAGSLLLATIFARLSRNVRNAGGPYAFTREGFGDFAGFLVAWGYWIAAWTTNAAIAVAFVSYLSLFWPALATHKPLAAAVGLATIWLLTWVNVRGVHNAGVVQLVTTILKYLPLAAIAFIGIFYLHPAHFEPFNASGKSDFSAVTSTVALTLWAFLGFESGSVPSDDVENPQQTMPRAIILGTLATAVVYILGTAAVMGVIPSSALTHSNAPFADAARVMWGPWAGYAIGFGAVISCFGCLNGWILMQGQVARAAARDGLFPKVFARMSDNGTPAFALIFSSVLVSALMCMNFSKGLVEEFTFILLLATLTTLIPYLFCSLSTIMICVRDPSRASEFEKSTALLGVLGFAYSLWAIAGAGDRIVYWGFLLLMAGLPIYVWLQWKQRLVAAEKPSPRRGDGQGQGHM